VVPLGTELDFGGTELGLGTELERQYFLDKLFFSGYIFIGMNIWLVLYGMKTRTMLTLRNME